MMSNVGLKKGSITDIHGYSRNGDSVETIVLTDDDGMQASVLTLGARLVDLRTNDGTSVVVSHKSLRSVEDDDAYVGAVVGRVANRIAGGRLRIDDTHQVQLECNENGTNHVHGGPNAYDKRLYHVAARSANWVLMRMFSPNGDQRYPGAVEVHVRYELTGGGALRVDLSTRNVGETSTVTNLTLHPYFDLSGNGGRIKDAAYECEIHAPACGNYLELGVNAAPTGKIANVASTFLDFRSPKLLRDAVQARGGCDHFLVMDDSKTADDKPVRHMITVVSRENKLRLDIASNQPGFQIYTANQFDGFGCLSCQTHGSLAIEPSGFIDACNHHSFLPISLHAGQSRTQSIVYKISSIA